MVEIKDLLEECRSNNGGERERESSGLSEHEMFRLRSVTTVMGSVQRYRHPPGSQRSVEDGTAALDGRHCRPSQSRSSVKLFCGLLWLRKRMLFCEDEHLVAQLTNNSRISLYSTAFSKLK